jgi:hypothetical protein
MADCRWLGPSSAKLPAGPDAGGVGAASLRVPGNDHAEGAGEPFDLQRTNAGNRAVDARQQKHPGAKHLGRRDVFDGEHIEPMLGGMSASHGQSQRPADNGGADHRELEQSQLVGDAVMLKGASECGPLADRVDSCRQVGEAPGVGSAEFRATGEVLPRP